MCLIGHFFGRYLSPECQNVTGKPGIVLFSERRYLSLKKSSKNIKFSQSYRSRHFVSFCLQKSAITFEISSQPRGDIHVYLSSEKKTDSFFFLEKNNFENFDFPKSYFL